jgi:hypothetical protein
LWNHPAASSELKKRIVRTVLHEIVIAEDVQRHGEDVPEERGSYRASRCAPNKHHRIAGGRS